MKSYYHRETKSVHTLTELKTKLGYTPSLEQAKSFGYYPITDEDLNPPVGAYVYDVDKEVYYQRTETTVDKNKRSIYKLDPFIARNINGYYPAYYSEAISNLVGDGTSTRHESGDPGDSSTYVRFFVPNGINSHDGDFDPQHTSDWVMDYRHDI